MFIVRLVREKCLDILYILYKDDIKQIIPIIISRIQDVDEKVQIKAVNILNDINIYKFEDMIGNSTILHIVQLVLLIYYHSNNKILLDECRKLILNDLIKYKHDKLELAKRIKNIDILSCHSYFQTIFNYFLLKKILCKLE